MNNYYNFVRFVFLRLGILPVKILIVSLLIVDNQNKILTSAVILNIKIIEVLCACLYYQTEIPQLDYNFNKIYLMFYCSFNCKTGPRLCRCDFLPDPAIFSQTPGPSWAKFRVVAQGTQVC